jgi:1,2-diacylglycerol 3-alpha-glucosyltransferase
LAREMSVSERVRFYQDLPRTELLQKYADADLFVLLSRYEAFGISVAEALASRTPCVVSNTSALAEWIDNTNCFGVNYPVKIEELSRTLNEVIGKRVGEVKLWDWDDVVRRLTEVYDSLVN